MTQLTAVGIFLRDHFSRGNSRKTFGYAAFHWGIILMPESDPNGEQAYSSFDATDATELDPVTFRMTNPTMDWWFRVREEVDPTAPSKLIGRVIGKVPGDVSSTDVKEYLEKVPLPVKNTHPQQSCVTWAADAISALQKQDWAQQFDVGQFQDEALAYGDERIKGAESEEPIIKKHQTLS